MGFPKKVKDAVLVKCKRSCSICHKFCGTKMELHHIIQQANGGEDTEENCIPLCLDCHAEVKAYNPKHPKGQSYSERELIMHRDNWYKQVSQGASFNAQYRNMDIAIYEEIRDLFNSIEYFLSKFNFAGFSFPNAYLEPLYKFSSSCEKPDFKFMNDELEKIKLQLNNDTAKFLYSLSIHTFPNSMDNNTVPLEWEYEQPERFNSVVSELNENSTAVWETFCLLVTSARKILAV